MPLDVFTQWSTAEPLIGKGAAAWAGEEDRARIASYSLYEQIFDNVPEAFELVFRGDDEKPIYIPAAKPIVNTLHRFLANQLTIVTDPDLGSSQEQATALIELRKLFRRERFISRFNANKRYGIIRGDWLFHIYADPKRPAGSRISIFPLDPASYFPITNDDNIDEVIGVHIAEYTTDADGKAFVYRLTYRKTSETGGPSPITVEEAVFDPDSWTGLDASPVRVIRPEEELPAEITQIPVYHIQNIQRPSSLFGTSELSGFERILTAINQTISDEDLALALESLGVYVTDGGAPVNPQTNQPEPWQIGPGRVIELATGKKFDRVNGVNSVTPYQEHLKYLHDQTDQAVGQPAVAKGRVDVNVAESGIALIIEMGPLLARVDEGELVITDVLTNMLFDLKSWFAAYEGLNFGEVLWLPKYGDKIPQNSKQRFDQVMQIWQQKLAPSSWVRAELAKLGYQFPDEATLLNQIVEEQLLLGQVQNDIIGARLDQELANFNGA